MKCVKHIETGKVIRIPDERAEQLVASGHYQFVPKSEYKKN